MRLQKYMAMCGVAARRKCEEIIAAGRVAVNGETITQMGTQVEEGDVVTLDGRIITPEEEKRYILYHKPAGEVTTVSDDKGRETVMDRFADFPVRLYPVGRLDYDSEGLLLMTNDGALAQAMLHPRGEVDKVYQVTVSGTLERSPERLSAIRMLDGERIRPAKVEILRRWPGQALLEITIHEGKNRQIRRMCRQVGLNVLRLQRVREHTLSLGHLKPGKWRYLTEAEIRTLKRSLHYEP